MVQEVKLKRLFISSVWFKKKALFYFFWISETSLVITTTLIWFRDLQFFSFIHLFHPNYTDATRAQAKLVVSLLCRDSGWRCWGSRKNNVWKKWRSSIGWGGRSVSQSNPSSNFHLLRWPVWCIPPLTSDPFESTVQWYNEVNQNLSLPLHVIFYT